MINSEPNPTNETSQPRNPRVRHGFTQREKRTLIKILPWLRAIRRSEQPHLTHPAFNCGVCLQSQPGTLISLSEILSKSEKVPHSQSDFPCYQTSIEDRLFALDLRILRFYEIDCLASELLVMAYKSSLEEAVALLEGKYPTDSIQEARKEIEIIMDSEKHPYKNQASIEGASESVRTFNLPSTMNNKVLIGEIIRTLIDEPGKGDANVLIDGYSSPADLSVLQYVLDLTQMAKEKRIRLLLRLLGRDISLSLARFLKNEEFELLMVFRWPTDFETRAHRDRSNLSLPSTVSRTILELLNSYQGRITAQVEGRPNSVRDVTLSLLNWGFRGVDFPSLLESPLSDKSDLDYIERQLTDLASLFTERMIAREYFDFPLLSNSLRRICRQDISSGWCKAGTEYLAIDENGGLYPCPGLMGSSGFALGRISQSGMSDADSLQRYPPIARPEVCSQCKWKHLCGGLSYCEAIAPGFRGKMPIKCVLRKNIFLHAIDAYLILLNSDKQFLQLYCRSKAGLSDIDKGTQMGHDDSLLYSWG